MLSSNAVLTTKENHKPAELKLEIFGIAKMKRIKKKNWIIKSFRKQWIYKEKNCKREYDYIVNCEDARGHILKRCIYERLAYNACVEDKLIQQVKVLLSVLIHKGYVNPWESNSPIAREHRARELEEFKKAQKA